MNADYITHLLDKETLHTIESHFINENMKSINIISFVKTFLNVILHSEEETIFLTLGLIDFFKRISESLNMISSLQFSDITTAVCNVLPHIHIHYFLVTVLISC